MSTTRPLGNFAGNSGSGGTLPILTLTANPTLVATGSQKAQLGTFEGELFFHQTGSIDTVWENMTASLVLSRQVGPLSDLAAEETALNDLATIREFIDRLVKENATAEPFNPSGAKGAITITNGQPSALADNDTLTVPTADNSGTVTLEFKRTGGFTPTPGFTTVDVSALVDGPDTGPHDLALAIRTAVEAIATTKTWQVWQEGSDVNFHSFGYLASLDGEFRTPAPPTWAMAVPDVIFSATVDQAGYSPLIDAEGGTQNNITRLGPRDVALLISCLPLFPRLVASRGYAVDFSAFVAAAVELESPSDVIKIRLAPDLPLGAVIVAAELHTVHPWAAPTLATITIEIDDNHNGTAGVVNPVDGVSPAAAGNIGGLPRGRDVAYLTATARITGDFINNLTDGLSYLEVQYRLPLP